MVEARQIQGRQMVLRGQGERKRVTADVMPALKAMGVMALCMRG